MNKRAVFQTTFVNLAMVAIIALILLLMVFPAFEDLFAAEKEKGACEWSLVMHSLTKLADWSLIPPECRAHRFEVSLSDLRKEFKQAKKRINVYNKDRVKYKKILTRFKDANDEAQLYEWALNKVIAVELKDCWEKVFKGRLPLFDRWWLLYSWGDEKPPGAGEEKRAFDLWKIKVGKTHRPPVNCIICSRIRFADDVKGYFGSREIDSLDMWLKYNYPEFGSVSYYESLAEGRSHLQGARVYFTYHVDIPLAVMYEKIYIKHAARTNLGKAWAFVTGGQEEIYEINWLKLVPYTQHNLLGPREQGGESCSFILD
jgi:hypothetical protein